MFKSVVKVCGSTVKLQLILDILSEMLRYHEELRLRRQPAKLQLTLRLESVGIKQD